MQPIQSESPPYKALAFVKTALLRVDRRALSRIDQDTPHPFALRDILSDSALYHATVFPLRHTSLHEMTTNDAIRRIIFESMKDASLDNAPMETLRWIAFEKWDGNKKSLPPFDCPNCRKTVATLPYDAEEGKCSDCGSHLYVTDMLGFHQDMSDDAAPDSIATTYMMIHETLLLFTGIRYFWENNRAVLQDCLFVKDGPLSIRAQYSKLVGPIRRFLEFSRKAGHPVHILGQEKTGTFAEHLELIGPHMAEGSCFVPSNSYIRERIQHRPDRGTPYGIDTNYGAKVLLKLNDYHRMTLNIPTGEYTSVRM